MVRVSDGVYGFQMAVTGFSWRGTGLRWCSRVSDGGYGSKMAVTGLERVGWFGMNWKLRSTHKKMWENVVGDGEWVRDGALWKGFA